MSLVSFRKLQICDVVAVVKILNATLAIPHLEVNPVWRDSEQFLFKHLLTFFINLTSFINVLKDDISISWSTREHYATGIRATRIKTAPVHASAKWNLENVLPMLERLVVTLAFCFRFRVELFFELWDQKNFCSELSLSMIIFPD